MATDKEELNKIEKIRGEHGRLLPGVVLNPNGRPKGISITEMVRAQLREYPEGSKETYGQLIVKRILHKAIKDGDVQLIKAVWNYMDGMPRQNIDMTGTGLLATTNVKLENLTDEDIRKLDELAAKAADKAGTIPTAPA